MQDKEISSKWVQSSFPIGLAGQLMSLLLNPEQRRLSSRVRVDDEAWKKLYIGGNDDHDQS